MTRTFAAAPRLRTAAAPLLRAGQRSRGTPRARFCSFETPFNVLRTYVLRAERAYLSRATCYVRTSHVTSGQYPSFGSTTALTDESGAVKTRYTYEPLGRTSVSCDGDAMSELYTGREQVNSRLYLYRARYYNPGLARFLSEDPTGFDGGIYFYACADNDPINRSDPTGTVSVQINGQGNNRVNY